MSTALAAADVMKLSDPGGAASAALQYGTALSAFATAAVTEGTVANYNAFDEQNFLLALQLHRALLKATGQADRAVRRARFQTVLQGQRRPAVLIEGGYLSSPAEARRIADPAFRQKLAEAVAEGVEP